LLLLFLSTPLTGRKLVKNFHLIAKAKWLGKSEQEYGSLVDLEKLLINLTSMSRNFKRILKNN
jgi:hypothetical protein